MTAEDRAYWEELPDGCPPTDAKAPTDGMEVIRLVNQNPPTLDDFRSFRTLNPAKPVKVSECQAHGLSVFTDLLDADKQRKLPKLKNACLCLIRLTPQGGLIKQTGAPTHHTWWPSAQFPILDHCQANET